MTSDGLSFPLGCCDIYEVFVGRSARTGLRKAMYALIVLQVKIHPLQQPNLFFILA